ncbi:ParB N-terminal domain-containing protein [Paracoccus tibetensis]|uniref:ParB-like nuclease domain-containing protein n=1 Tax=Paracoccus tibetensis TaxID=336292 RepID=A0A1G5HDY9_9RHOB|nr:ParB N-terminal domain-containing protein [Paracoccus tibetensis]SCY62003.1 ParB-like nuclease domain-containing protein [Paracoccus tibetensis]
MTDYRAIDLAGMQPAQLASQPAPQLMWIEIKDLVIDDRYQRLLAEGNKRAISKIAADFRWSRFSPVLVAPIEGGRYALIDGQHRAHAAALCGIERVPAMVALVAPEEQAAAFIDVNTRQIRVSPHQIFRAALLAGEDWAVRCREAVEAAGCRLMGSNANTASKRPGQIYAIGLIRRMIEAHQEKAVTVGLTAMRKYDAGAIPNYSDALLTPWLGAVAATGAAVEELVEVLRSRRPWLVIDAADRMAEADGKPKATMRRDFFIIAIQAGRECVQ